MSLHKALLAVVFASVAFGGCSVTQGQKSDSVQEQREFLESEPFRRAVPLPPKVLAALLQRKEVKDALRSSRKSQRDEPSKLFQAAEVHLRDRDEVDLVVEGFRPVSGADNSWFWIVLSARSSPKIALWTQSDSLDVIDTKTNDYRNIRCRWSSASGESREWEYYFNGKKYVLWKQTQSEIRSKE